MKTHNLFAIAVCLLPVSAAQAQSGLSVISVPVEAPLAGIESYMNTTLPRRIHEAKRTQTCVKAEEKCMDIPEFRGFKIYSRRECVTVSPRIDCNLHERIDRAGPLRIRGDGNTMILTQALDGTVTGSGRGEIGKHIRQTVRAKADFTVTAMPRLQSDWKPHIDTQITHQWRERPSFRLFNLIDISIGSHVDPALKRAIGKARDRAIPDMIRRLDLRSRAADLWAELQDPIPVKAGDETLWLHVRPTAIGFAQPRFDNGRFRSALSISAFLGLRDTPERDASKTPLPDLTRLPAGPSRIVLPVSLGYDTINALIGEELPRTIDFDKPARGSVKIRRARLSHQDGEVLIMADVRAKMRGLPAFDGEIEILGKPVFDPRTQRLELKLLRLSSDTAPLAAKALNWAVTKGPFGGWLRETLTTDLDAELRQVREDLDMALNREIAPGLRLEGTAGLDIRALRAERPGLVAELYSEGTVRLIGSDLMALE